MTYAFDRDGARRPGRPGSGDVLFQGSIGRTDLPGGDHATLLASIATLAERYDDETVVYPGTWASRRSAPSAPRNPFLQDLPARQA